MVVAKRMMRKKILLNSPATNAEMGTLAASIAKEALQIAVSASDPSAASTSVLTLTAKGNTFSGGKTGSKASSTNRACITSARDGLLDLHTCIHEYLVVTA